MTIPKFAPGTRVSHPYDLEVRGVVKSQDQGSVIVRWDNGDVDSQGAFSLRRATTFLERHGDACEWLVTAITELQARARNHGHVYMDGSHNPLPTEQIAARRAVTDFIGFIESKEGKNV